MDILKIAEKALSNGYNVIVADSSKEPMGRWKQAQEEFGNIDSIKSGVEYSMSIHKDKTPSYLGLVCGKTNGNLEVVDVDTKNAIDGDKLYTDYIHLVNSIDDSILPKCSIQETVNGGYHVMYRADKPYASQKLANRNITEEEVEVVHAKEMQKLEYDLSVEKIDQQKFDASVRNLKSRIANKKETLIETRGQGGYVAIQPSSGYKFTQGSLATIPTLTKDERDVLVNCARQLDQVPVKKIAEPKISGGTIDGLSPLDDYNQRATSDTVVSLLQGFGWEVVSQNSKKIYMLRDGSTTSKTSGNYDIELGLFSVFSTSTVFETEKGYSPASVYAVLEHNGDYSAAAKKLYADGYGDRMKPKDTIPLSTLISHANIETDNIVMDVDDVSQYIYSWDKIDSELDDWFSGRVKLGESTGVELLDHWFKFKRNALYLCTGKLGRGKTTIQQFLFMMATVVNGWKWLIVCMENSKMDFAENLITFLLKENAKEVKVRNPERYFAARDFVREHYQFVTSEVDNIDALLKIATEYHKTYEFDAMFIDPINSISPKMGHDWDFTTGVGAASKILRFREEVASVFISQHPIMSKQRESGSPSSVDGEGGYFANKADFAFVLDRESGSNETNMKIDKVRNRKSGGNETDQEFPIQIIYKFATISMRVPYHVDGRLQYQHIGETLPDFMPEEKQELIPIENKQSSLDDAFGEKEPF